MSKSMAIVNESDWRVMLEQADFLVKSGYLPEHVKTPAQAVAIMLKGRELGVPPMQALSTIAVIKGKPTMQAELMAAVIERDYGPSALRVESTDTIACTVSYTKPGWPERQTYTFTMEMAKRAELLGNQTWKKYPEAMLRARCISAVAKLAFQASIGGMYTPEEMGADVVVTEDGEVVYAPKESSVTDTRETAPQAAITNGKHKDTDTDEVDPGVAIISAPKVRQIVDHARDKGVNAGKLREWVHEFYGCDMSELTVTQGREVWRGINELALGMESNAEQPDTTRRLDEMSVDEQAELMNVPEDMATVAENARMR